MNLRYFLSSLIFSRNVRPHISYIGNTHEPFYISICISTLHAMFTFNSTTDQLNRDESFIEADYLVADYYKIMIGQLIGLCQLVLFCRSPVPTHFRNVLWGC